MNLRTLNRSAAAALLLALAAAGAAPGQQAVQIVVVEGEGAESSVEENVGAPLVVELRDASGNPVPRAEVTFRSPSQGPSATFFGAANVSKAWTDENGRAQSASLTPNRIRGPYAIVVEAEHQGATASAEVQRANVGPEKPKKKRRVGPKIWIPAVVGAVIVIIGLARGD